jgi:hypothetical protein
MKIYPTRVLRSNQNEIKYSGFQKKRTKKFSPKIYWLINDKGVAQFLLTGKP